MDHRLYDILRSLLANIEVMDEELMRFMRSELIASDATCLGLTEQINDACLSTLQNIHSVQRKMQSNAFIIPENISATLE